MSVAFPQSAVSDAPMAPPLSPALPQAAVTALWRGHMIEAVKLVRLQQNISLNEAKDQVDAYLRSQPVLRNRIDQTQAEAREGLLRWLVFLLAGGAGLAYLLT